MGMFDYVKYPAQPCWKCGQLVDGWQSKDGPCELEEVEPCAVRVFYSGCHSCHMWNQYRVVDVYRGSGCQPVIVVGKIVMPDDGRADLVPDEGLPMLPENNGI